MFGIAGKSVVVTGSASGIGRAIALGLARCGARVIAADVNEAGLNALVGPDQLIAHMVVADVASPNGAELIIQTAVDRLGSISVLVNCAGVSILGQALDLNTAD